MLPVQQPIIIADKIINGMSFSEEACLKIVESFKKEKKQLPIHLILGTAAFPLGLITDLEYNKEHKVVIATIVLFMDFGISGTPLVKLDTPEGVRVSEYQIKGIGGFINIPKPKEEPKIITK